jgi:hypothetical protein
MRSTLLCILDRSKWFAILSLATPLMCGCGNSRPPLAPVRGVAALDGKPLAYADIVFEPDTGRQSSARTDEQGRFRLEYLPGIEGALIGQHTVRIHRMDPDTFVDYVPPKYNAKSELRVKVAEGPNQLDFNLKH